MVAAWPNETSITLFSRCDVLELGARLSFREKILWLEEGARLTLVFKGAREHRKEDPPVPNP
jgi:hypothetical protein